MPSYDFKNARPSLIDPERLFATIGEAFSYDVDRALEIISVFGMRSKWGRLLCSDKLEPELARAHAFVGEVIRKRSYMPDDPLFSAHPLFGAVAPLEKAPAHKVLPPAREPGSANPVASAEPSPAVAAAAADPDDLPF